MKKSIVLSIIIIIIVILTIGVLFLKMFLSMNATKKFLGDESTWSKIKIDLKDTQPISGGRDMAIDGSGAVSVTTKSFVSGANNNPQIGKYSGELNSDEFKLLVNLFIDNDFLKIDTKNATALPDQAVPEIVLTNANGKSFSVLAPEDIKNRQFQNLYGELIRISNLISK